jgi:hypothetical protein
MSTIHGQNTPMKAVLRVPPVLIPEFQTPLEPRVFSGSPETKVSNDLSARKLN